MTAPMRYRYGQRGTSEQGSACTTCGTVPPRPVTDHCHKHGWFTAEDLGPAPTTPRVEVTFRVPRYLRDGVKAYATRRGLTVNAAGNIALDEFLRAEDARLGSPTDSAPKARGTRSTR